MLFDEVNEMQQLIIELYIVGDVYEINLKSTVCLVYYVDSVTIQKQF